MSKIEWTEKVWNPVTGCTRASAGCDNCYAVAMTRRLAGMGQKKYAGLVNPGKKHFNGVVKCHEDALSIPLRTKKPTRFFVNSMSDLFHEAVPGEFIEQVFDVMLHRAPQHTYQVLTKRTDRMELWVRARMGYGVFKGLTEVPAHIWMGTSVEDQPAADWRIPHLLRTPAAVRWLSMEPLIGAVDLHEHFNPQTHYGGEFGGEWAYEAEIHWVVVGGESGPKARPMHPDWLRGIRELCEAAGVPFFFKQWGTYAPVDADPIACEPHTNGVDHLRLWRDEAGKVFRLVEPDGDFLVAGDAEYRGLCIPMQCVGKKAAGRLLDGIEHNDYPQILQPA